MLPAELDRRLAAIDAEMRSLRQDFHSFPELAFEERRTAARVADLLEGWGIETHREIAGTGVIGVIRRGSGNRNIALRADMDALPIAEETGLSYASRNAGKMHACGHDGHTTTLLAAARVLAEAGEFDGTLTLIFQPAEEDISGARRMVEEKVLDRFGCDQVYAIHNLPGLPFGEFALREGAIMAASDAAAITVFGKGGHGAEPHNAVDPVVAAASIVMALQTLVARSMPPHSGAVVTVGTFHAGTASNVIPATATMDLSIRSYTETDRAALERLVRRIARDQAASYGARAEVSFGHGYPSVVNTAAETDLARRAATAVVGPAGIRELPKPLGFSEDFAFLLQQRPGAYVLVGAGDEAERAPLHNPCYDFNDDLIARGAAYWVRLAETALATPLGAAALTRVSGH
jgi:hippurate hydrolase